MRTFIQAVSLGLFTAFFVFATYKLPEWFPADIYLRLDRYWDSSRPFGKKIIGRALWSLVVLDVPSSSVDFFALTCVHWGVYRFAGPALLPQKGP